MSAVRRDWGHVARRGEVSLRVMTVARARAEGLGHLIRQEAAYLCVIMPDDGEPVHCNFMSLPCVTQWIQYMAPRSVTIAVAKDEDHGSLKSALDELAGADAPAALH